MKKHLHCFIAVLTLVFIWSCKSYSKYTIDEYPQVKIDSSLYGIWKAVEDTDKANFILVQSPYDIFHNFDWLYHLDSSQKRAYLLDRFPKDTQWVKEEMDHKIDVATLYERYDNFIKKQDYYYYITYFSNHGKNPRYQQWSSFTSIVNNKEFLNIPYRYVPMSDGRFLTEQQEDGYFFVRLININKAYDTITTAIIADTKLKYLTSSKQVREHIEKNINKASFYCDTLHFYKVSGYHLFADKAMQTANLR